MLRLLVIPAFVVPTGRGLHGGCKLRAASGVATWVLTRVPRRLHSTPRCEAGSPQNKVSVFCPPFLALVEVG